MIICIFIMVLLPIISAVDDDIPPAPQVGEMELSETQLKDTFYGKTVEVIGSTFTAVTLDIDGYRGVVEVGTPKHLNGLQVQYLYKKERTPLRGWSVVLNLSIDYVCGNGVCDTDEHYGVCCRDCACPSGTGCFDNRCIDPATNACTNATDCNDNNPCTNDLCIHVPRECVHEYFFECKPEDDCCPRGCEETDDIDCSNLRKCTTHQDCEDGNDSTQDNCSPITERCFYSFNFSTPQPGAKCDSPEDCDDDDPCTDDRCSSLTGLCYRLNNTVCNTPTEKMDAKLPFNSNAVFSVIALALLLVIIGRLLKNSA